MKAQKVMDYAELLMIWVNQLKSLTPTLEGLALDSVFENGVTQNKHSMRLSYREGKPLLKTKLMSHV